MAGVKGAPLAGSFGHKNYGPAVVGGPTASSARAIAGINGTTLKHKP
jgi:hypothetical protein